MECSVCGSSKVENRELGLCATHNREHRRQQAAAIGGGQRGKSIQHSKRTLKSSLGKKKAATAERDRKIAANKKKRMRTVKWCESCGRTGCWLTWSHILSVKQYEEFATVYENGVLECMDCHHDWEHSSYEQKTRQPLWEHKKQIILTLKPEHLTKLQLKSN